MYEYPYYHPSLGFWCVCIATIAMFFDSSKDLFFVFFMFIQMTCLYMTVYVEYQTYQMKKLHFYLYLDIFQQGLKDIALWESEKLTPEIILNRYRYVFGMFEASIKHMYKPIYKTHVNRFNGITGEINRLTHKTDLTYGDLVELKLSIKTLVN